MKQALFCLMLLVEIVGISSQSIFVKPDVDQILPINDPDNVTFICNVSGSGAMVIWEVQGRQIQVGQNPFMQIGILLEVVMEGVTKLIITSEARNVYQDSGIMLVCTSFTPGLRPIIGVGEQILYVRIYDRPSPPGRLRLIASEPLVLAWEKPTNIPEEVDVNYTITINSSTSDIDDMYFVTGSTQHIINITEAALSDRCKAFQFFVIASVAGVPNSEAAFTTDTIPLSTNVSSIDQSLRVNSVDINNGSSIRANLSFAVAETCSSNFPIRNYTIAVDGQSGPTLTPPSNEMIVTGVLDSSTFPALVSDQQYLVGVVACSDVACRNSITVPLNTTDVQSAQVVFFKNNIFLSCSFARQTAARGCAFRFQVNLNQTEPEEFEVLRSMEGQQCNISANQQSGYMDISVMDIESDMVKAGVLISVETIVVESESNFTELTGCTVIQDEESSVNVVAIVVPIVVVLVLGVGTVVLVVCVVYFVQDRKLKKKKPKLSSLDHQDTLFVDISSDNKQLISTSPMSKTKSASCSVPVTSHPVPLNPQASLPLLNVQSDRGPISFSLPPERPAPIEVELHRNTIRLKVNKASLRAVARFHSMAKRAQSEGSIDLQEGQSLLELSHVPSRVHMSEEFSSLCCDLPPVEEGEEEDDLKSLGIINFPASISSPPQNQ